MILMNHNIFLNPNFFPHRKQIRFRASFIEERVCDLARQFLHRIHRFSLILLRFLYSC
ncbi:unnamed protein product [Brassica rapa subsp. narinosa]